MTLPQAFQRSAVPVYRTLVSQMGSEAMTKWLQAFEYGNQDISSGLDDFWLSGSLQISALEQVAFLRRIANDEVGLDAEVTSRLLKVMQAEKADQYTLYAKTGAGYLAADETLGWYVGWVDNAEGRYYFALNVSGNTFADIQARREALAKAYLRQAGLITD